MRQALVCLLVLGLWCAAPVLAQEKKTQPTPEQKDPQPQQKNSQPQNNQPAKQTHLGIGVADVPPDMINQLPAGTLPQGQGVLVLFVEQGSPAAKAGLQRNDILVSMDNHKLASPADLVKLVRADKSGQEVTLSYLRGGKSMTAKATLTEAARQQNPGAFPFPQNQFFPPGFENFGIKGDESNWSSFDALRLKRMGDKKWQAEIDYRNKEGKKETKTFTGSREEIRNAIMAEKDLPALERRHLLRAMNLSDPTFRFYFPPDFQP